MSDALAQAAARDKAEKEKKAQEKANAKPAPKDPNKLELPWKIDAMKAGLTMGITLEYAVTGINAKGKPVDEVLHAIVKANDANEVGTTSYLESQAKEPIATQIAKRRWSQFSPFFAAENVESELVKKETLQVPAGSFDCVVADLHGALGEDYTVWMIVDKPGIYAQVADHGNSAQEDDQSERLYTLTKLESR